MFLLQVVRLFKTQFIFCHNFVLCKFLFKSKRSNAFCNPSNAKPWVFNVFFLCRYVMPWSTLLQRKIGSLHFERTFCVCSNGLNFAHPATQAVCHFEHFFLLNSVQTWFYAPTSLPFQQKNNKKFLVVSRCVY